MKQSTIQMGKYGGLQWVETVTVKPVHADLFVVKVTVEASRRFRKAKVVTLYLNKADFEKLKGGR